MLRMALDPYPARRPGWGLWDLLLWANGGAVMKRPLYYWMWIAVAVVCFVLIMQLAPTTCGLS